MRDTELSPLNKEMRCTAYTNKYTQPPHQVRTQDNDTHKYPVLQSIRNKNKNDINKSIIILPTCTVHVYAIMHTSILMEHYYVP